MTLSKLKRRTRLPRADGWDTVVDRSVGHVAGITYLSGLRSGAPRGRNKLPSHADAEDNVLTPPVRSSPAIMSGSTTLGLHCHEGGHACFRCRPGRSRVGSSAIMPIWSLAVGEASGSLHHQAEAVFRFALDGEAAGVTSVRYGLSALADMRGSARRQNRWTRTLERGELSALLRKKNDG